MCILKDTEIDSGRVWVTEKAREFFGIAPDRETHLEGFLDIVHLEDREKIRVAVKKTPKNRGHYSEHA